MGNYCKLLLRPTVLKCETNMPTQDTTKKNKVLNKFQKMLTETGQNTKKGPCFQDLALLPFITIVVYIFNFPNPVVLAHIFITMPTSFFSPLSTRPNLG